MFLLLKKYKKGVSPVIAVVLLIALTVAAAAIIWTLTSDILDTATGDSLLPASTSGSISTDKGTLTVSVKLSASTGMTLNKATLITHVNSTAVTGVPINSNEVDLTLNIGDNSITLTFTGTAGDFQIGSYNIDYYWIVSGGSQKITGASVQAS